MWHLENELQLKTFLVGREITIADVFIYATLKCLKDVKLNTNTKRYYSFIDSKLKQPSDGSPSITLKKFQATLDNSNQSKSKEEGTFPDLNNAEMGKVVTRFPPEASGYLHIGHAKAALINYHYRNKYNGRLRMRFDDTNPAKENEEFEKIILEDLKLLKVEYDDFSCTSDLFPKMIEMCTDMIKKGFAYGDDTPIEQMRDE